MLNMPQHPSASPSAIASLRNQLAAGRITNPSRFWREAESLNIPLVVPAEGVEDEREVTFLWHARHPLQGVCLLYTSPSPRDP